MIPDIELDKNNIKPKQVKTKITLSDKEHKMLTELCKHYKCPRVRVIRELIRSAYLGNIV